MNKLIKKVVLSVLILDILLLGWFVYKAKFDLQHIVDIKYAFSIDHTSDIELFNSAPSKFDKIKFLYDPPELIELWRTQLMSKLDYVADSGINSKELTKVELAKSIILLFSKNGGYGCSVDIGLMEKLRKLPEGKGYGCCTDHTEVFIALSTLYGMTAREVHSVGHVTNEFYSTDLDKWVWVDPIYAIMAKDATGTYLSISEMRDRYYADEDILFQFFGTEYHLFENVDPHTSEYYDSKYDFSDIMVTWGNNVFTEAEFYNKFHFIPKMLRQTLGISSGIMPSYIGYIDNSSVNAHNLLKLKLLYTITFILFGICNIFLPFYIFIRLADRNRRKITTDTGS